MAQSGTVYIDNNTEIPQRIPEVPLYPSTNRQKETKKLNEMVDDSDYVIFEISSVFPFDLFPDKIIIDKSKITIIRRELFFKRIFPIPLRDLLTVRLNRSIIFAALEFEIKGYNTNPRPVRYLWPAQAMQAEKYILGLVEAVKKQIDLTHIKKSKIVEKMEDMNTGNEEANMF